MQFSYLAYNLWFRRNKVVFENFHRRNIQVVDFLKKAAEDYGLYSKRIYGASSCVVACSSKKWLPLVLNA